MDHERNHIQFVHGGRSDAKNGSIITAVFAGFTAVVPASVPRFRVERDG
jgi:hypothetical protein